MMLYGMILIEICKPRNVFCLQIVFLWLEFHVCDILLLYRYHRFGSNIRKTYMSKNQVAANVRKYKESIGKGGVRDV